MPNTPKVKEVRIQITIEVPVAINVDKLIGEVEELMESVNIDYGARASQEPIIAVTTSEPYTPLWIKTNQIYKSEFYEEPVEEGSEDGVLH